MGNSERCECFFKKRFQYHNASCVFCRGPSPSMCPQSSKETENWRISRPTGGNKSPQGWHDSLTCFFSKLLSAPIESWTITWPMGLCGNEITVLHSPQRQAGGKLHKWEASNWSRLQPLEKVGLVECRAVVLLCTLTSWDLAKDVCQRLLICCDECCRKVWRQMTLEKVQVGAVRMLRCSTPLESMKNAGMSELHPPLQVLPACSLCVSSCLCSLLPPPFPRWGSYSIPSCTHGNCPFPRCHQPWAGFHRLRIN